MSIEQTDPTLLADADLDAMQARHIAATARGHWPNVDELTSILLCDLPRLIAAYRAQQERIAALIHGDRAWVLLTTDLKERIAALEAAARAVVEGNVVEAVYTSYDYDYCMACERTLENGHDADCPIGTLAALLGGEA